MVHRKISYTVILFCCLALTSCKKQISKWPVYVTIKANMAHNEEPISGIKWKIIEKKGKNDGQISSGYETTGREFEGVTDDSGIAIANFNPRKGTNYSYDIIFDYSSMNVPQNNYEVVLGPNPFAQINRFDENYFEIRILPYMDIEIHHKNINCFDENDSLKFKNLNLSEKHPWYSLNDTESIIWITGSSNQGCADWTHSVNSLAGKYIYIWEAKRNNLITTGIDTFYLEPEGNNSIDFFW